MTVLAVIQGPLRFLLQRVERWSLVIRSAMSLSDLQKGAGYASPECTRIPHTIIPASPHSVLAETSHQRQTAELQTTGTLDILLVGDSLAEHWPAYAWHPWGIYSLGVGGDLTQHILWRLDQIVWGTCRPKRILIAAGTNNLLFGENHADVASGIEAIAERLVAVHPAAELFVLLPPPFGLDLRRADEERQRLKARLNAWCGHRLIDADAALLAGGRQSSPNYQPDLVHLTARGYEGLTDVARAACERANGDQNGS
ncbi:MULTISPECIES: GDSL-type esterase/lipase family protein [unclassified Methylobacterium]|uniref:GDSL-type esterase/lipase family protein n=1 Tax=unclassified Methylobacterium TaxID=2615210 RepID=UPI002269A4DF|nr:MULTISPECIES: GDSL-type esterase/lipase family protein [unclassified Methylobacterium]